jgi:hypothetical protein
MNTFEADTAHILDCVTALPGWAGRTVTTEPAIPVLASPSWRGIDGTPWRVIDRANDESLFVKTMTSDAPLYIDVDCAFEAAQRAADLGIGPKVLFADPQAGILVMEELGADWRVGTLDRLLDPAIVDAILAARRRFQQSPPLAKTGGVFAEIEHFLAASKAAKAELPKDTDWLAAELRFAGEALRAIPAAAVPIHGDGNISNVMIHADGDIRLIDWDRATNADPLEDLGSFLVESFEHEPEAREAFARHFGSFDEGAYNRARLYGIADDLRWALIGAFVAAKSPRTTCEFYKFASWRFLRCRLSVRAPRFSEALRRLA